MFKLFGCMGRTWKPQLTASLRWLHRINTEVSTHGHPQRLGDSATHPIEPRSGTLAALLLLAGTSPRRRRALPAHRITAHSGASNCGFQVETT
jgi:hypothetical protein